MLAARAARSMRGGGGAREMKAVRVGGSERVRNDGRGVIVCSWSVEVRPLETSMAVGTWRSVPEFCGGRKKGAAGCLLSSSAKGSSQLKGECLVCSGGRGVAIDDGDHHGGVISDRNSYRKACRLVYHGRGTAGS